MATIDIEVVGLEDLTEYLMDEAKSMSVRKVVKSHGAKLQQKAQRNAVFRGHYEWERGKGLVFVSPTGTLKRSIGVKIENGGMRAVVEPQAEYAGYVECGTRFMEAQPFLKPAVEAEKNGFIKDVLTAVKD